MDQYRNQIVPSNDQGKEFKELKKRMRERDGSENEGRLVKRPRANTSTLLPSEPEDDRQDISEPLKPEDDLDRYDGACFQQRLRYIDGAAKQKITPRTKEFLRQQDDAYKVALEVEVPDKASSRAIVQALDKVYYSASFYFKPRSPDEHDHLMSYVKLRQLELLANYGDYLGHEASLFRATIKEAAAGEQSENSDVLEALSGLSGPRQLTVIADELKADVTSLRKNGVHSACAALGIDADHMLWLIEEWAQRNRLFHNSIRDHISGCHWTRVAEQLCRDLKELHNVVSDEDAAEKYGRVLLGMRDSYFDVYNPVDFDYWFPNEKARKLSQEILAKDT